VTRWCRLLWRGIGGELRLQAQRGTVQALTEAIRRLAENGSSLSWRKPVPADKRERFAVSLAQARQRGHDASVADLTLAGVIALDMPGLRFDPQAVAPRCTTPLGSRNVARDSEKPWQRRVGHVLQPPPDDEERLGDDIIDRLRRRSAPGVRPDRRMVLAKQRVEPRSPGFKI